MSRLQFTLEKEATGSRARAGRFRTLHNEVLTPIFMPVGTNATVRGQRFDLLEQLDYSVLLANTYHLMLRPGAEVFRAMGGIQKFMGWPRSVLTDSGGFQIFSLPNDREISEEGALFRGYVDQRPVLLTPELSIETQKAIGSDIMMVLDQCVCSKAPRAEAEAAMHLTHRWAKRSFIARGDSPQSLFGIVQGACYPDLRRQSADVLTEMPFDGFAIGGLAVGETKSEREDIAEQTVGYLPRNLPRYLMGVGTPIDILEAVHRGVDMFDCILPSALGQQGVAFTNRGKVDLRRGAYKFKDEQLDPNCPCTACSKHSMAYLHHLIRVKEALGSHMVAAHNLHFYSQLMKEIRASILNDTYLQFYAEKKAAIADNDRNFPVTIRKPKPNRKPLHEGDYEVHETQAGVYSVRHRPSGEVMHSVNDPTDEANALYVAQSRLVDKLNEPGDGIVLWDIGLGAGINAMAVVKAYEQAHQLNPNLRALHLVSFENDLDSFRLGLRHQTLFKHLRHAAPVSILKSKSWAAKQMNLKWTLLEGDFQKTMHGAPAPHIVFFDPFSQRTDGDAWTFDCFKNLHDLCKDHPTEIFTYSSSTAVRALLLGAGFYVAKGQATGPRSETTVALTPKAMTPSTPHTVLNSQWLERWERSSVKFPSSIDASYQSKFESDIRSHPQFLQ